MKNFALKIVGTNLKEVKRLVSLITLVLFKITKQILISIKLVNSSRIRKLSKELLIDIMKYTTRNDGFNINNGSASLSSASALTALKFNNSLTNNNSSLPHQSSSANLSKEDFLNQRQISYTLSLQRTHVIIVFRI